MLIEFSLKITNIYLIRRLWHEFELVLKITEFPRRQGYKLTYIHNHLQVWKLNIIMQIAI